MKSLNYNNVYLTPSYSELESRELVDLSVKLFRHPTFHTLGMPVIAANMKTVTGPEMVVSLHKLGAMGILHRFHQSADDYDRDCQRILSAKCPVDISIGVNNLKLLKAFEQRENKSSLRSITIDIAHGHHIKMKQQIALVKGWIQKHKLSEQVDIIAGNVCTSEAVEDLTAWGANIVKVGIGPGSACTTRIMTGYGLPQFSAVLDCARKKAGLGVKIIADGGISSVGDIAKALAAGADAIMTGSLFAGTKESPGPKLRRGNYPNETFYKSYMGSASYESKLQTGNIGKHTEGVSMEIPYRGAVKYAIQDIHDGLCSAFSYAGASNLKAFHAKATWTR
ncbi:MAG: guanosine monophosphate reductase [Candidatus Marinimicrobia bacterium]|nr:guanosine monophosphate reductase [Candidatus Neomarinimicrobiota bacterium]